MVTRLVDRGNEKACAEAFDGDGKSGVGRDNNITT